MQCHKYCHYSSVHFFDCGSILRRAVTLLRLLLSMELSHDRRTHLLKISLFFFVFFFIYLQGIPFQPCHHFLNLFLHCLQISGIQFVHNIWVFCCLFYAVDITFQAVSCGNLFSLHLIFFLELLGLSHHAVDVCFREPTGVVSDGDGIGSSSALVLGRHI